jgi:hypothetical protein
MDDEQARVRVRRVAEIIERLFGEEKNTLHCGREEVLLFFRSNSTTIDAETLELASLIASATLDGSCEASEAKSGSLFKVTTSWTRVKSARRNAEARTAFLASLKRLMIGSAALAAAFFIARILHYVIVLIF